MAVCVLVPRTGTTSHVRPPEIESSLFRVSWFLASWVATCVFVAVPDPDVVHLFVGDQVRRLLASIGSSPIVTGLASSVFKPTDPTLLVTRFIPRPPTVEAVTGLSSRGQPFFVKSL
jgi:hypothetical protein